MPFATTAIVRNHPQQDLMNDLRFFIGGAAHNIKCNPLELAKTALSLLKSLPASRDAILEYFCDVFDKAVKNYIEQIETEIATGHMPQVSTNEEATLSEIHTVLCNFVTANAVAWAPIISAWSLELLGDISTKYAGRAHISSGLNETLQLWMNCRATRTLIDITTQCLSCLIHADTEACINALLDTSIKHSPNFDWVVAHVGSCFPNTVITRVLSCGLKDFSQHKSIEQGKDAPKLISVVGILGHLAGSHFTDIRLALLDLFKWSLQPLNTIKDNETKLMRNSTVPFLLQLASMSPTLLKAITIDIKTTVPLNIIVQLSEMTSDWCKYFGSAQLLSDLLVHLIIGCEKGAAQIITLLLDCIFTDSNFTSSNAEAKNAIREKSRELLEYVLQEMDLLTRAQNQSTECRIKIIDSLTIELYELYPVLLSPEKLKYETVARIITYIGSMNHTVLIKTLSYLLQRAKSDEHLALMYRILSDEFVTKTSIDTLLNGEGNLSQVLELTLKNPINEYEENFSRQQMWLNLLALLRWEISNQSSLFKSKMVSKALSDNLINITNVFNDSNAEIEVLHLIIEIIYILDNISNSNSSFIPPLQLILNLTNVIVNYFFLNCKQNDIRIRYKNQKHICGLLKRLCTHSKIARSLALKEILDQSIFTKRNILFGAHVKSPANENQDHLLLKQIKTMSKTVAITRHSSVYNGGIVGHGKQKLATNNHLSKEEIMENTKDLIQVLKSCCMMMSSTPLDTDPDKAYSLSLDALTSMSLLLVQFISPDVMYNGLPWPEEEFSKVTIERDLYIRRLFNSTPALWELLRLVALHRPSLCYCSVLLRALTATLLHQWNSMGEQSKTAESDSFRSLMETTIKVLDIMSLGQLLPPPLSFIRDVVPYLQSFEITSILRDCIWNYMRDHIPSPALFSRDSSGLHWRDPTTARPPPQYTDTLRFIMQKNIKNVGYLYSQMFINIARPE